MQVSIRMHRSYVAKTASFTWQVSEKLVPWHPIYRSAWCAMGMAQDEHPEATISWAIKFLNFQARGGFQHFCWIPSNAPLLSRGLRPDSSFLGISHFYEFSEGSLVDFYLQLQGWIFRRLNTARIHSVGTLSWGVGKQSAGTRKYPPPSPPPTPPKKKLQG